LSVNSTETWMFPRVGRMVQRAHWTNSIVKFSTGESVFLTDIGRRVSSSDSCYIRTSQFPGMFVDDERQLSGWGMVKPI
jgi:hypothetical protein